MGSLYESKERLMMGEYVYTYKGILHYRVNLNA